jgi:hypothetical protein
MNRRLLTVAVASFLAVCVLALATPAVAVQDFGDSNTDMIGQEANASLVSDTGISEEAPATTAEDAAVGVQLDPEEGVGAPGGETTFQLGIEHLDGQFDADTEVRALNVRLDIDTDVAAFTEAGVDLYHDDAINDGFTEVTVLDNGQLQLDITYSDYRPGNGSTAAIPVADITVDIGDVQPETTTAISFVESGVYDPDLVEYPSEVRNSTLTATVDMNVDLPNQELGAEKTATVGNVDSDGSTASVLVTYEADGETVVAGVTSGEFENETVPVAIEDVGGFTEESDGQFVGNHTASILRAEDLSGTYEPGDTLSAATGDAVLDQAAATLTYEEAPAVEIALEPGEATGEPGGEATFELRVENLDGQFDESQQVRAGVFTLAVDTDVAAFTEAGVDLFHEDAVNDGFTEVNVSEDGSQLQLDITYDDYRPGDSPADGIAVANITVDIGDVQPETTTAVSFVDGEVYDPDLAEYPSEASGSTLAVTESPDVELFLDPDDQVGAPGGEASFVLGMEHVDGQFDGDQQVRAAELGVAIDTEIAAFTEAGVELRHEDAINDAFTEVNVSDDGSQLQLDVTYSDYRPGDGPADVIPVADITVEMQEADSGETTELTFLTSNVLDPDIESYATKTQSATLGVAAASETAVDLSFEHASGTGLAPGAPQQYELVLSGATEGISSYDLELGIEDDDVASFVGFEELATDSSSAIEDGGTTLNLSATLEEPVAGSEAVVLADVFVEADPAAFPGEGTVTVNDWQLTSTAVSVENADSLLYQEGETAIASQDVAWVDVTGNGMPATDRNGDGLLGDVTGDQEVGLADALVLFDERNTLSATDALVPYFDYDGNGNIGLADALLLFDQRAG